MISQTVASIHMREKTRTEFSVKPAQDEALSSDPGSVTPPRHSIRHGLKFGLYGRIPPKADLPIAIALSLVLHGALLFIPLRIVSPSLVQNTRMEISLRTPSGPPSTIEAPDSLPVTPVQAESPTHSESPKPPDLPPRPEPPTPSAVSAPPTAPTVTSTSAPASLIPSLIPDGRLAQLTETPSGKTAALSPAVSKDTELSAPAAASLPLLEKRDEPAQPIVSPKAEQTEMEQQEFVQAENSAQRVVLADLEARLAPFDAVSPVQPNEKPDVKSTTEISAEPASNPSTEPAAQSLSRQETRDSGPAPQASPANTPRAPLSTALKSPILPATPSSQAIPSLPTSAAQPPSTAIVDVQQRGSGNDVSQAYSADGETAGSGGSRAEGTGAGSPAYGSGGTEFVATTAEKASQESIATQNTEPATQIAETQVSGPTEEPASIGLSEQAIATTSASPAAPTVAPPPEHTPAEHRPAAHIVTADEVLDQLSHLITTRKTYPEAAKRRNAEGSVRVSMSILPNGSLKTSGIVMRSGSAVLDRAALDLVKGLFPLSLQPGVPMDVVVTIEYKLTR